MPLVPRLIPLAIAALLIAGSASAQEAPIDLEPIRQRVKQLLWSPLPKDQAWGAFLIGDLNLDELAPDLIDFIERERARRFDGDREYVLRAAVDSMIRLKISPPQGLLEPLFETISSETIILFAPKPRDYADSLLCLAQSASRLSERFALLNLIVEVGSPGAAAWLLRDLEIEAKIHIADSDAGSGFGSGSDEYSGTLTLRPGVPSGYPPLGFYDLSSTARTGSVLLTNGAPIPIYHRRLAVVAGSSTTMHDPGLTLGTAARLEYLAHLAARPARPLSLKPSYARRAVPADGDDAQLAAAKLRAGIEADYYAVVTLLRERGTLTSSEAAGLRPQINLTVVDIRLQN